MSQMRCFFLLTLILGLCCIIECHPDRFKRESTAAKKNAASTKNSPRRGYDCYYPYRSNTPLYCNSYFILFGKYAEGDKLVLNKKYSKPNDGSRPLTVEVVFESANDEKISYIYVEDSKQSERIYGDDLKIIEGGIGEKSVKLIIKSDYSDPAEYRVAIYAR